MDKVWTGYVYESKKWYGQANIKKHPKNYVRPVKTGAYGI